jgi:hypothetical protein
MSESYEEYEQGFCGRDQANPLLHVQEALRGLSTLQLFKLTGSDPRHAQIKFLQEAASVEPSRDKILNAQTGLGKTKIAVTLSTLRLQESARPTLICESTFENQGQVYEELEQLRENVKNQLGCGLPIAIIFGQSNYVCQCKLRKLGDSISEPLLGKINELLPDFLRLNRSKIETWIRELLSQCPEKKPLRKHFVQSFTDKIEDCENSLEAGKVAYEIFDKIQCDGECKRSYFDPEVGQKVDFGHDQCGVVEAKQKAKTAAIVVANYSYYLHVFQHLYKKHQKILDEAHEIYDQMVNTLPKEKFEYSDIRKEEMDNLKKFSLEGFDFEKLASLPSQKLQDHGIVFMQQKKLKDKLTKLIDNTSKKWWWKSKDVEVAGLARQTLSCILSFFFRSEDKKDHKIPWDVVQIMEGTSHTQGGSKFKKRKFSSAAIEKLKEFLHAVQEAVKQGFEVPTTTDFQDFKRILCDQINYSDVSLRLKALYERFGLLPETIQSIVVRHSYVADKIKLALHKEEWLQSEHYNYAPIYQTEDGQSR